MTNQFPIFRIKHICTVHVKSMYGTHIQKVMMMSVTGVKPRIGGEVDVREEVCYE